MSTRKTTRPTTRSSRLTTRGALPSAHEPIVPINPKIFVNSLVNDDGVIHEFESNRFFHRIGTTDAIPHIKNDRIAAMASHKRVNTETFMALTAMIKSGDIRLYGLDPKTCDGEPWLSAMQIWAKTYLAIETEEKNNEALRKTNNHDLQSILERYCIWSKSARFVLGDKQGPWTEQRYSLADAYEGGAAQYLKDWQFKDVNGLPIKKSTELPKDGTPTGMCFRKKIQKFGVFKNAFLFTKSVFETRTLNI